MVLQSLPSPIGKDCISSHNPDYRFTHVEKLEWFRWLFQFLEQPIFYASVAIARITQGGISNVATTYLSAAPEQLAMLIVAALS